MRKIGNKKERPVLKIEQTGGRVIITVNDFTVDMSDALFIEIIQESGWLDESKYTWLKQKK